MKVKIKRIDQTLPLPEYQTNGAAAFDLVTRQNTVARAHSVTRIPCNVIVKIPPGYMLFLKDRSSTAMRKGLLATAGIIDQDFCGPEDELQFQVFNPTSKPVIIERGERIAQAIFVKIGRFDFQEVLIMTSKSRGGFGTTGSK